MEPEPVFIERNLSNTSSEDESSSMKPSSYDSSSSSNDSDPVKRFDKIRRTSVNIPNNEQQIQKPTKQQGQFFVHWPPHVD